MLEEIISELAPILIFVVIAVFASASKVKKARTKQGSKPPLTSEGSSDTTEKKPSSYLETFKQTFLELADGDAVKKDLASESSVKVQNTENSVKIQNTENSVKTAPVTKLRANTFREKMSADRKADESTTVQASTMSVRDTELSHRHTAESATIAGKAASVKTERVIVGGSAGGAITEGCIEHYDVRAVIAEMPAADDDSNTGELQRIIVLGEILNNPRYKAPLHK